MGDFETLPLCELTTGNIARTSNGNQQRYAAALPRLWRQPSGAALPDAAADER